MSWDPTLHPRIPGGPGGGEFTGKDWAAKTMDLLTGHGGGHGARDRSAFDSGIDWAEMARVRREEVQRNKEAHVRGSDAALGAIYDLQGYHAKPEVVSHDALQERIRGGALGLWRGVEPSDDGTKSANQIVQEYKTGDRHYPGLGFSGNGTYTAADWQTAIGYTDDKLHGDRRTEGMMQLALAPDARTITVGEINKEYKRLAVSVLQGPPDDPARVGYLEVIGDPGRLAALMGYDAIAIHDELAVRTGRPGPPVIAVVLNRGKTIVADGPWRR